MFFLILTSSYFIPVVYLFFRLKILFISPGWKIRYAFIFWLLALFFPWSEILAHRDSGVAGQIISLAGGYMVSLFLYLFLCVLLYDLFLVLNILLVLIPLEVRRNFKYRRGVFLGMMVVSILVTVAGIVNLNTVRTTHYQISIPAKNTRIKSLRIAFVADLHYGPGMRKSFLQQVAGKINACKPDLILFGGDMSEGDALRYNHALLTETLGRVHARIGSYGVAGNHEYHRKEQLRYFYDTLHVVLLQDSSVLVDSSFVVVGRNDPRAGSRKSLQEILGPDIPKYPLILLDHRPVQLDEVSRSPVDMQFSGHTHNGQLFPLNLIEKGIYELTWGHRVIGHTHFFVTSGLRLWGPQVKTAGKSEIMVVDVSFQ